MTEASAGSTADTPAGATTDTPAGQRTDTPTGVTTDTPAGPRADGAAGAVSLSRGPIPELGVDIIRVSRIGEALQRFGARFVGRVLTPAEASYVQLNAERFAGRWAAKEAVSKVLGLGVRGVGWRDIEVVRLPTGQPAVRLSGRALARAQQLGMGRIALSITHEHEYAVAVASGVRTEGGAFLFPPDIEERLDERERRLLGRMDRIRALSTRLGAADGPAEPR